MDLLKQLRDSTNAQIRALTRGDITKEATIMNIRDFMADFTSLSEKIEFTSVLLYQGFLALDPTTPDVHRGK